MESLYRDTLRQVADEANALIAKGDRDTRNYDSWAKDLGFSKVKVFDWTSSAGDWVFIVSKDGIHWHPMFQENNHPRWGYTRRIYVGCVFEGTADDVLEEISELCNEGGYTADCDKALIIEDDGSDPEPEDEEE